MQISRTNGSRQSPVGGRDSKNTIVDNSQLAIDLNFEINLLNCAKNKSTTIDTITHLEKSPECYIFSKNRGANLEVNHQYILTSIYLH
jgi:hypothetical protein